MLPNKKTTWETQAKDIKFLQINMSLFIQTVLRAYNMSDIMLGTKPKNHSISPHEGWKRK